MARPGLRLLPPVQPQPAVRPVLLPAPVARHPQPGLTWLHGPAGSGKSHLLQALCAAHGGDARYLPLDGIAPLRAEALAGWQGASPLCIDAMAAVVGDAAWERELFNLYRDCDERGAPIVMAARETPRQLGFVLPDLASRCAAGELLSRVHAPVRTDHRASLHAVYARPDVGSRHPAYSDEMRTT